MKKLFVIVLLASVCAISYAQKKDKEEKNQEYVASIIEAVKNTKFTFSAMSMKPSLGKLTPVDVKEKTIDIVPGHILVELPYDDAPSTAYDIPSHLVVDEPAFDSEYTESDKVLNLKVTVSGMAKTPINPNSKMVFQFRVKKSNGSASVEVTPDISHPITYSGVILPK